MKRHAIWLLMFALVPTSAMAANICCSCKGPPDPTVVTCLTADAQKLSMSADDCTGLATKTKLPTGWTCDKTPLTETKCATTSAGGVCPKAPTSAYTYTEAPGEAVKKDTTSENTSAPSPDIIPTLNVPIPGFTFTGGSSEATLFGEYVAAVYRYGISIVAVIATVMFVFGAFQFLLGSAITQINKGRTIMIDAVMGMFLVIGASLILRTINPATVKLVPLDIQPVFPFSDLEPEIPTSEQGKPATFTTTDGAKVDYIKPKPICKADACAAYCDGCNAKKPLPEAPWIPKDADLAPVAFGPGLEAYLGAKKGTTFVMRKEASDALVAAGKAANEWSGGPYTLRIAETHRPLSGQLFAACQKSCGKTQKKFAAPGASLHGTGLAVDLSLYKGNVPLATPQDPLSKQETLIKPEYAKLLQDIMASAGWVRYCPEVWHFQYGTPEGGEMSKNCPWPPPLPK